MLREGLEVNGEHLTFFYKLPKAGCGEVKGRFQQNRFSITRKVRYHAESHDEEMGVVIFLNGIPLMTMELKNRWTGQSARMEGIQQYMEERDPGQPLLNFGRCLVHFAVDSEEVYLTSELCGKETLFHPLEMGDQGDESSHLEGYRTAHLWEEVLQPVSLANMVQWFGVLESERTTGLGSGTLLFSLDHEQEVVRRQIAP